MTVGEAVAFVALAMTAAVIAGIVWIAKLPSRPLTARSRWTTTRTPEETPPAPGTPGPPRPRTPPPA